MCEFLEEKFTLETFAIICKFYNNFIMGKDKKEQKKTNSLLTTAESDAHK